jgi:hypothetical protein
VSAFALGGFGIAAPGAPARVDARGEARLALILLAAASACVYAIAGATVIGRLPETGAALLVGAALQATWPLALRRRPAASGLAGVVLNAALIAAPVAASHPITLLAVVCVADSVVLMVLVPAHRRALAPGLAQVAIVLAVASLTALAGGHMRPPSAGVAARSAPARAAFYCSLL